MTWIQDQLPMQHLQQALSTVQKSIRQTVTATVIANQNPALLTVKIASPETYSSVGQNITYTYNVTNTGNVIITGPINVTDNKAGTLLITAGNLAPWSKCYRDS